MGSGDRYMEAFQKPPRHLRDDGSSRKWYHGGEGFVLDYVPTRAVVDTVAVYGRGAYLVPQLFSRCI